MHVSFVSLQIEDSDLYDQYRAGMRPILERFGGRFLVDIEGGKMLLNPAEFEGNRHFLIAFPDPAQAEAFFADPDYQGVKKTYFEPSVAKTFVLGL